MEKIIETKLIENMTPRGASLREVIRDDTGCDPLTERAFAWSNFLLCDGCWTRKSTALVILNEDGVTTERLCCNCYMERTR